MDQFPEERHPQASPLTFLMTCCCPRQDEGCWVRRERAAPRGSQRRAEESLVHRKRGNGACVMALNRPSRFLFVSCSAGSCSSQTTPRQTVLTHKASALSHEIGEGTVGRSFSSLVSISGRTSLLLSSSQTVAMESPTASDIIESIHRDITPLPRSSDHPKEEPGGL